MTRLPLDLPEFTVPLPADELRLLATLPEHDEVRMIDETDHAAARRLAKRGLIKIHLWKDDPIGNRTMYAGRIDAALRQAGGE